MLKLDFNIHDPTLQNLAKGDPFIATTILHNPLGEYSVYQQNNSPNKKNV